MESDKEMDIILSDKKMMCQYMEVTQVQIKKIIGRILLDSKSTSDKLVKSLIRHISLSNHDYFNRVYIVQIIADVLNLEFEKTSCNAQCWPYIFGSTVNSVGFFDSDVDVYMEVKDDKGTVIPKSNKAVEEILELMRKALKRSSLNKYYYSLYIKSKRCPIIKIVPIGLLTNDKKRNIQQEKQQNSIRFHLDINVNHSLGVFNSLFLKHLFTEHPVLQEVIVLLKYWGKHTEIVSSSGFTSFAFIVLVLFFFQQFPNKTSPILSSNFDEIHKKATEFAEMIGSKNVEEEVANCIRGIVNVDELAKYNVYRLVIAFFGFIAEFNFSHYLVFPLSGTGVLRHKYAKMDHSSYGRAKPLTSLVTVIDPFEPAKNISAIVTANRWCHFLQIAHHFNNKPEEYFRNNPTNLWNFLNFNPKPKTEDSWNRPCSCFIIQSAQQHEPTEDNQILVSNLVADYRDLFLDKFIERVNSWKPQELETIYQMTIKENKRYGLDALKSLVFSEKGKPKDIKLATIVVTVDFALIDKKLKRKSSNKEQMKEAKRAKKEEKKKNKQQVKSLAESNTNKDDKECDQMECDQTAENPKESERDQIKEVKIHLIGWFYSKSFFHCRLDLELPFDLPKNAKQSTALILSKIGTFIVSTLKCSNHCETLQTLC